MLAPDRCPLCAAGGTTIHETAHQLLHGALELMDLGSKPERDAFIARYRSIWGDQAARDLILVGNATRAWARQKV